MGLGGYLTWTAVIREIKQRIPSTTKIIPIEAQGNTITKIVQSPIFDNNPAIIYDLEYEDKFFLQLNNPQTNYCIQDLPDRAIHRKDKHIIAQICESYGIESPELKCELYFTAGERQVVNQLKQRLEDNFVVVEPHSKINYTKNRVYPYEKWQKIVNSLSKDIEVVQVGNPNLPVLENVTDLTGKTTFREATLLIGESELLLSTEGGLTHAATAVDTTSLVVITGYQSLEMVAYPQNINLYLANHGPCGLKAVCESCKKEVEEHDFNEIIERAKEFLS
tara:strand:- start:224 stop:1057 length:834 start_codon:yes stop_codon:yes gene_type:complete